jgi:hypothetical protein
LISKACDITGIVAIACARHGCFAPNSIVDLYRGEQQKNMDWAFLEAIRTTRVHPKQGVFFLYDLVCSYWIYLQTRIGHLLPRDLEIDRAIGLFHVHDHKDECFFRFASSFIPGAGIVAGEILESLWSGLNRITPSTRTATLAHRAEVIDDHACDSNHKKALGMGNSIIVYQWLFTDWCTAGVLCNRFVQASEMVQETLQYYDQMTSMVAPALRQKWEKEIVVAESQRLTKPSVMDIIGAQDIHIRPGPTSAEPPQKNMEWLDLALSMEERQYVKAFGPFINYLLKNGIELIFRTRFAVLKRSHVKRPDLRLNDFGRFSLQSSFCFRQLLRCMERGGWSLVTGRRGILRLLTTWMTI